MQLDITVVLTSKLYLRAIAGGLIQSSPHLACLCSMYSAAEICAMHGLWCVYYLASGMLLLHLVYHLLFCVVRRLNAHMKAYGDHRKHW